jgi:putative DNA-invertase from lambdoid prophage Rac
MAWVIIEPYLLNQWGGSMATIAYYRVSTADQSVEAQRHALTKDAPSGHIDEEFRDEGVSGAIPAAARPGFAKLLSFIRKGDVLYVYAVDRLGRDALDVQSTVRNLLEKGIAVEVHGLGRIARGVGELILAVLAQVAEMEKRRITERTAAGRDKARESLAATGKTHKGKASLGRPLGRVAGQLVEPSDVAMWRYVNEASIADTASTWALSESTVKRYCVAYPPIPRVRRQLLEG